MQPPQCDGVHAAGTCSSHPAPKSDAASAGGHPPQVAAEDDRVEPGGTKAKNRQQHAQSTECSNWCSEK
eukprot:SAG31_NODE_40525_length_280_cov_0.850829_1_plen_68_part_10